jgi:hypothetical protein
MTARMTEVFGCGAVGGSTPSLQVEAVAAGKLGTIAAVLLAGAR